MFHSRNDHQFHELKGLLMTVSKAIQDNLDAIHQTQSLVKSVGDGLALQSKMIADQGKQIADLQAQLAAGATLSTDDVAALVETNADIAAVNISLAADIPANTVTPPTSGVAGQVQASPKTDAPAPLAGTGSI